MKTGRPILILGGTEDREIDRFKRLGMKQAERKQFYLVNIDKKAKPDLVADFEKPLPLADSQFEAIMMAGVPYNNLEDSLKATFNNAHRLLKDQGVFLFYVGVANRTDQTCEYLKTLFPNVYYTQPSLMLNYSGSLKLYNGRYKERLSAHRNLGSIIVAFKGKTPASLEEISKQLPGFKYILYHIIKIELVKIEPRSLSVSTFLSAVDDGLDIAVSDKKDEDKSAIDRYETLVTLRALIVSMNVEVCDEEYCLAKEQLTEALYEAAKDEKVHQENLAELNFQLSLITNDLVCSELKESQEEDFSRCRELVNILKNADLATQVENFISATRKIWTARKANETRRVAWQKEKSLADDALLHQHLVSRVHRKATEKTNVFWWKAFFAILALSTLITLSVLTFGAILGVGAALTFASVVASTSASANIVAAGVLTVFCSSAAGLSAMLGIALGFRHRKKPMQKSTALSSAQTEAASTEQTQITNIGMTYSSSFRDIISEKPLTQSQMPSADFDPSKLHQSPLQVSQSHVPRTLRTETQHRKLKF